MNLNLEYYKIFYYIGKYTNLSKEVLNVEIQRINVSQ